MSKKLIWVRVKRDVICGGRELFADTQVQVTTHEFRELIASRAAVPCAEPGNRSLTTDRQGVAK